MKTLDKDAKSRSAYLSVASVTKNKIFIT
jgi:hypothetical protein